VIRFKLAPSRLLHASCAALAAFVVAASMGLGMSVSPYRLGRVRGTSMLPTLHTGDLVLTKRAAQYRVGQLVVYRNPVAHRAILHRIVWSDGRHFVFKGDNNTTPDTMVASIADLEGRTVLTVPLLGTTTWYLAVTMLMLLLIWGTPLRRLVRRPTAKTAKKGRPRKARDAPSVEGAQTRYGVMRRRGWLCRSGRSGRSLRL